MNIEQYISELLYRYQCVIVPNLGAFLTETITTTVQENTTTFFPPKKIVSFNSYIKNNDGLLANHIALQEGISYVVAVAKLDSLVKEWEQKLQRREFIVLKNIGILKYNIENHIVFEAFEHTNYLTSSFGFTSLVSPTIKREVLKTIVPQETITILEEEEKTETTLTLVPQRKNPFKNFLKYTAVLTVSIGAGTFGYLGYLEQQEQSKSLMVQKEVQKEVETKLQEATFFIENPVPLHAEEKTLAFHLVAGSFRSLSNAERTVNELKTKGFSEAKIMPQNEQGLFPVFYGSYATYTDAQHQLTTIQEKDNPEAWLLIKNL
ncbi:MULTISPECIES: SPOR domain-containing protein [Flavobacterium]|uniref:SPOR domain-containing protein n=2 Tax=Flavobacterium TaxID=237 RepID=A0A437UBD1_9FLAO|nr:MULTISPECIES: SPOR domain-containing protein [Flavobacterium]OWP83568.1 SPOR domain-containing protein [Flavobacterium davisii]QYS87986.1 SPOR domain-containing protein [Flavobacterium davisii]RVU90954.1 SPOR domain-containing protein [Flavobacterium columnare]SPE78335.1 Sporulation related domain protein [Flavobacterium columnare]